MHSIEGRNQVHTAIWDQDYPTVLAKVTCAVLAMCAEDDSLIPFFDRIRAAHPKFFICGDGPSKVLFAGI